MSSSGTGGQRRAEPAAEPTGDCGAHNTASDAPTPAAGQPDPLLSLLRPPQADGELGRLAHFAVTRLLGRGGMGAVFAADDLFVRREVALKVMRPEFTSLPEARDRFLREAQTAGGLEHDHVIPVYQVAEDNGVWFIVMPLLEGEALDERLKREARLPIPAVLKLGRETAEGLAAAHAHGLVHRDIKPANLWLEGTGEAGGARFRRIKILDFGLARAVQDDQHLTAAGGVLGTPAYMAPEQAAGEEVDCRADLFSLGCVLYRCCTGEPPLCGPNATPVREKNPDVSPALADLVMRLLAKAPGDRPQSAEEVAEALRRIEEAHDAATVSVATPRRRRVSAQTVCVTALVGLGLAAAGVVGVKGWTSDGKGAPPSTGKPHENVVAGRGFPPLDPGWLARTAASTPDDQIKEVTAELTRRNPGFADTLQVGKDNAGRATDVIVMTTDLEDLSPFHGLPALRSLRVNPTHGTGKVSDLSCLRGENLTSLDLSFNDISDLSPLTGMPLALLAVGDNPIRDLSPLRGMRLHTLAIPSTYVTDLCPLRGMPLEQVWLINTPIRDLAPLSESPLKGVAFSCDWAIDAGPLRERPLEWVDVIGPDRTAQLKVIRDVSTLKTINGKPAADFWKTIDAGDKPKPAG